MTKSDDIVNDDEQRDALRARLAMLYIRGYRCAVGGGTAVLSTDDSSAYVQGFRAGLKALREAIEGAEKLAHRAVSGANRGPGS